MSNAEWNRDQNAGAAMTAGDNGLPPAAKMRAVAIGKGSTIVNDALVYISAIIRGRADEGRTGANIKVVSAWTAEVIGAIQDALRTSGYTVSMVSDQRDGDSMSVTW